ncbi:myopalladin [Colossoma macropomum]|uniref:myopalladin n=1 Tax=Colossoma macropomum TaxID=42526 RepID=UPI001863D553|nr:myopalladin [Colossoma macropomum]
MQENEKDRPTSVSQFLQESYLAETHRIHHRHTELGCSDCPHHVVYGNLKGKAVDSQVESQFPDLSVFLSQEELNKSVDLACKSFGHESQEQEDSSDVCPQIVSYVAPTIKASHEKMENMPDRQVLQSPTQESKLMNIRTPREPIPDLKKPTRNSEYGLEIQSKKEFLNKAADFIEELSSLFKANSSKRIRPRACKGHRSRYQSKHQFDAASFIHDTEDRERPILHNEPLEFHSHNDKDTEEPNNTETEKQEPICEIKCEAPVLTGPESSEPVCKPPHFVQKLKSREVPEGSKVQLDCIVRGLPAPEIRWFCEGKELENSPDIQIINNGELHSLIITEAFEEDTGRYSCFASNFCGTDSTSAEIYIEGVTSSDSDGEQYFESQMHKRASPPNVTILVEAPTTSLNDEDSTSPCFNQSTPPENFSTLPNPPASPITAAGGDTQLGQVKCSTKPVKEPPPVPKSQLISTAPNGQSVNMPTTATLSQETSNSLSTAQQNFTENENGYPQGLDGRPIMAAPVFTKNLQDLLAFEGQLVVLECRVKGVPSPKVDWYREGMLIEDSPDFRILQKKPRSMAESENICTLVIAEVFLEDSGTFTCTASNKYGTVSSVAVLMVKGNGDNSNHNKTLSTSATEPCHHDPDHFTITSKHPLASCLKTRSKKVLESHSEPQSSSRVGRRVTFKLPEDEENTNSNEDIIPNKDPPPVLAKPKLNPLQLQILHKQVLLEQQQESDIQNLEHSELDQESLNQCNKQVLTSLHPVPSPLKQTPPPFLNTVPLPQINPSPVSLLSTIPAPPFKTEPISPLNMASANQTDLILLPEINPSLTVVLNNPPTSQQNIALNSKLNTVPTNVDLSTQMPQMILGPAALTPELNMEAMPSLSFAPVSPITHLNVMSATPLSQLATALSISVSQPVTSSATSFPQVNVSPTVQLNTGPTSKINMTPPTLSSTISQMNIAPATQMKSIPITQVDMAVSPTHSALLINSSRTKLNSTSVNQQVMEPTLVQGTNSQNSTTVPLNVTSSHMLKNTALSIPPVSITQTPPICITSISNANFLQSFSYTRPKEFIASHILSQGICPSPTLSSATQNVSRPTTNLTSPNNQLTPSLRVFPTRLPDSPSSPPYVVSPPLVCPALVNSVFSLRPQSPPQASSPTSSGSTSSPIQNPVAFLSSVLPSLPTSPPTNAMGLPMRAPRPQATLNKNHRSPWSRPDEDIPDGRVTLSHDIEKKLQLKNELPLYGQQKLTYGGEASRPLGPNIPTATLINYDEEYKVSNFEQRLMSEIEFRLERTPVEESDDEIQHDEVPTGKCIAPLFDKKLKNFRAMEGVPVTFTCKVVGIPIPKVYWFKDGKQILKKNRHFKRIREGDGTCCLYIEAATNDDDGNYTVMAANPQGRISCSGHLIVQSGLMRNRPVIHLQRVRTRVKQVEEGEPCQERFFQPHFLQAPGDMVSHEGRLCRLDCKVSGLPHPEIIWLLNGKPICPDLTHRMLVRENGIHSLVIDPLTKDDAGTYTCIASNKAGQGSFCLTLSVVEKEMKQAPQFVEKLQNTGIAEGTPVRLECRVVGMPPPVLYWKKDNDTISDSKERFSLHQDATGYGCLLIQPTRKEDAGWYTVSAKNEAGIISCTARLDIYAHWHQWAHPLIRKTSLTGSHFAALTGEDKLVNIKPECLMTDNCPMIFTTSQDEHTPESEEL